MDASHAEMAIERAEVFVLLIELAKIAQVRAKFFGCDGRIFPSFPRDRLAGNERRRSQTRLANLPDGLLVLRVVVELHGRFRSAEDVHQVTRLPIGVFL